jgi:CDP-diglyceride synthetase
VIDPWSGTRATGQVLYLLMPLLLAGVLHAYVIKREWLPALARPLDCGRQMGGRPVLGENKTFRGPVVMSASSVAVVAIQRAAFETDPGRGLSIVDYSAVNVVVLGLAFGLSYSLAELPNSFIKRRLGIHPGHLSPRGARIQYLADQSDSVIGGAIALVLVVHPTVTTLLLTVVVGLLLHVLFDQVMYASGVKKAQPAGGFNADFVIRRRRAARSPSAE